MSEAEFAALIAGHIECTAAGELLVLIAQGVHPRVIMEILGHSQISTTMNTYAHVLPATQREATAKIDALFPERATPNVDDGPENPQASVR
jgi:hypothetical protein